MAIVRNRRFHGVRAGGALLLLAAGVALAQDAKAPASVEPEVRKAISGAQRSNPNLKVQLDPRTGLPTKIRGLAPNADLGASRELAPGGLSPDDAARKAVQSFFAESELSAAFPTKNAETKVEPLRVRDDPDVQGQKIVNIEQRVRGIPVFGSTGRVIVSPSLGVTQMTATLSTVAIDKTEPSLDKDKAIAVARGALKAIVERRTKEPSLAPLRDRTDTAAATGDLVVFDPALLRSRGATSGPARLAWLVSIDTFRFFIDAETGAQLFMYRDQPSGALRQVYDLAAKTAFPGKKVIDDTEKPMSLSATASPADTKPADKPAEPKKSDADSAYEFTGRVAAFYADVLGRKGIVDTDQGALTPLESYVRYGDMENAFWCKEKSAYCPKPSVMVYGPGYASAIDVVGHEMTHGVITAEADLIYADEPGAVNESFADLFGTLIEYNANGGNGNWVIGESIPGFSATNPLRNMADPHLQDADGNSLFNRAKDFSMSNRGQPDHYADYVKREDPLCESTSDYFSGCVHFNSGILNKFVFLMSEGGRKTIQENGAARDIDVKGLGRVKTARIAYRTLTTQLHANSGLIETAEAFVQSCRDLVQANPPVTDNSDCDQIDLARTATGLFTPPSQ